MNPINTVDLAQTPLTLAEVLKLATVGSVRIVDAEGRAYVLEEADDFDEEVKLLGQVA